MPKAISEDELQAVEAIIRSKGSGASMGDLLVAGDTKAARAAMQRRLDKLISAGRVKIVGSRKGARYWIVDLPAKPKPVILNQEEASLQPHGLLVQPSHVGLELQKAVRLPTERRAPVGYRREFLSQYRPNETHYLTPRERDYLAKIGAAQIGEQPAGTYARQILNRLLIDMAFNSSRLEGNQYSILETHVLLEQGKSAEGKSAEDTQMILNHNAAIEFLVEEANEIEFDYRTIVNLHALLSDNLLPDPQASGRLRKKPIRIGRSVYHPLENPYVIEDCFNELLAKASNILDPFEQAFFVIVQLAYLQAFEDVNKRVSRLAANIPFIRKNLSPLSFVEVEQQLYHDALLSVYELNRTELARDVFIWAYERSAARYAAIKQATGQPDPFRLRHREMLRSVVAEVIRGKLGKREASSKIRDWAQSNVSAEDQARFIEIAESDLIGMHEGNYARYKVRPSEYYAWKQAWDASV
jgi:hypothetical protein